MIASFRRRKSRPSTSVRIRHWTTNTPRSTFAVINEIRIRAVQSPANKLLGIRAATTVIVDLLTTSPKRPKATLITAVHQRRDRRRSLIIQAIRNPDDDLPLQGRW